MQPVILLYFYYILGFRKIEKCPLKIWLEVIFNTLKMSSSVMKSSFWVNVKVKQITSHFY